VDLEVDSEEKPYRIGVESLGFSGDWQNDRVAEAYQHLEQFRQQGLSICGHNFRRFNYPCLIRERPSFSPWQIVDTLELSVLAFPLQRLPISCGNASRSVCVPPHQLSKDYKLS
jgi:ATP-dependent DNA helicase RecQ